ncbi:MAG: hypothetical protein R3E90_15260 [Marinicella sp.]
MQPVTIRNNELVVTLSWLQYVLIGLVLLVLVSMMAFSYWLCLLLPLLLAAFWHNIQKIKNHAEYHLVLNAQNQWHLVHQDSHQVEQAELQASWHAPAFIAVSLSSSLGNFWYMMLRSRLGGGKFARVLVGLNDE